MLFNFVFWCTGIAMLCVGILMRIQLRDYVDMSVEGSGAALLGLACLGGLVVLAATLACCCTARGHPALLYLYGGFLAVVALLELGAGASVYAYRTTLTEGFDQGLNDSMALYGIDKAKSAHIDVMQSTGCYDLVIDFINSNIGLVAGSAVGVAFFPLIGVFLACCLASNINKAKYEQVA
ncbi:hypothetical protein G9C98_007744 [Cotesia typhae]|uniref:Tetraspanin n=1 Tax=Cotesia typhae TaxID=2053667 RepID=A0A8J5V6R4_9HYME|nr:hypothetical protein G9C98_007744 [Cotesia typhae]